MIRRKDECSVEYNEHLRGGDGTVKLTQFIRSQTEYEINDEEVLYLAVHINRMISRI